MWFLLALVIIFGGGAWLFIKLRNSKMVDNITENLLHEKDYSFKTTPELIRSANDAEGKLDKRVEDNEKAAEVLAKENELITSRKVQEKGAEPMK